MESTKNYKGGFVLHYILRSENGTVVMDKDKERVFFSKEEALTFLLMLSSSTNEQWSIIHLKAEES